MKMFELRKERGFSLVELMIVVAIIAILAAIAIPAFMRFALKAKTSEASTNLAAIRTCEESYRAEDDVYLACLENPDTDPSSSPQTWLDNDDFDKIGFEPDGEVRYTYKVDYLDTAPNTFTAEARGNLDDDTEFVTFTIIKPVNGAGGTPNYPKPLQDPLGEF